MFERIFVVMLVLWLLPCTTVITIPAFRLTAAERQLRNSLRRVFPPLFLLCILCAAGSTLAILSLLSHYTLFEPIEYWHSLILVLSATIGGTLIVLVSIRPTRLENALTRLFDRNPAGYKGFGIAVLLGLLAAVVFALYQYHRFTQVPPV